MPDGPERPQDRATSGDPLRAGATAAAGLVERLALFLVEQLPAIADMPATDTRQCHGIGHAPTGAVLPDLAEGFASFATPAELIGAAGRLPALAGAYRALIGLVEPGGFLKFLNKVNRPSDVAKHQPAPLSTWAKLSGHDPALFLAERFPSFPAGFPRKPRTGFLRKLRAQLRTQAGRWFEKYERNPPR